MTKSWFGARCVPLAMACTLASCSGLAGGSATDSGPINYGASRTFGVNKALVNNLVGRWYTKDEIARLDDDTMTPDEWCAREPSRIMVSLDDVEVTCPDGAHHIAAITRVDRGPDASIVVTLRGKETSKFRQLGFEQIIDTTAVITGSPCVEGRVDYARFPKIELLNRQILNGKSCAQLTSVAVPEAHPTE